VDPSGLPPPPFLATSLDEIPPAAFNPSAAVECAEVDPSAQLSPRGSPDRRYPLILADPPASPLRRRAGPAAFPLLALSDATYIRAATSLDRHYPLPARSLPSSRAGAELSACPRALSSTPMTAAPLVAAALAALPRSFADLAGSRTSGEGGTRRRRSGGGGGTAGGDGSASAREGGAVWASSTEAEAVFSRFETATRAGAPESPRISISGGTGVGTGKHASGGGTGGPRAGGRSAAKVSPYAIPLTLPRSHKTARVPPQASVSHRTPSITAAHQAGLPLVRQVMPASGRGRTVETLNKYDSIDDGHAREPGAAANDGSASGSDSEGDVVAYGELSVPYVPPGAPPPWPQVPAGIRAAAALARSRRRESGLPHGGAGRVTGVAMSSSRQALPVASPHVASAAPTASTRGSPRKPGGSRAVPLATPVSPSGVDSVAAALSSAYISPLALPVSPRSPRGRAQAAAAAAAACHSQQQHVVTPSSLHASSTSTGTATATAADALPSPHAVAAERVRASASPPKSRECAMAAPDLSVGRGSARRVKGMRTMRPHRSSAGEKEATSTDDEAEGAAVSNSSPFGGGDLAWRSRVARVAAAEQGQLPSAAALKRLQARSPGHSHTLLHDTPAHTQPVGVSAVASRFVLLPALGEYCVLGGADQPPH